MRIGNSKSISYQRLKSRQHAAKQRIIARLCYRLDQLVARAEALKTGRTRKLFLDRADVVREKLKNLDH